MRVHFSLAAEDELVNMVAVKNEPMNEEVSFTTFVVLLLNNLFRMVTRKQQQTAQLQL